MSHEYPDNSDDIINSRSVIKRIDELEDERQTIVSEIDSTKEELEEGERQHNEAGTDFVAREDLQDTIKRAKKDLKEWDESSDAEELKALKDLQEQAEGYSDWRHGVSLIRDSYFKTHAQELADDIGAVNSDAGWPNNCIDWDQAATELQMDYTSVEFDGVTYWLR
jgi:chromosome segregation ATPase